MPKPRLTFSKAERRRIQQVREEVNRLVGIDSETDADHGYRAAKQLMDLPDHPDKTLVLYWCASMAFQKDATKHNTEAKRQIEETLRRCRNHAERRPLLLSYLVTGPGNTRPTVGECIESQDVESLLRAMLHIISTVRGMYEPLSVYSWGLACIDAKAEGRREPRYIPLSQKDIDNDLLAVLMNRYKPKPKGGAVVVAA